jgi:pyrroline-5-carboxylate reductase
MNKVLFIGCGNMATAIATALKSQAHISTYTPSQTRAKNLADAVSGTFITSYKDMINYDFIFLCFKPQQFPQFCDEYKNYIDQTATYVSVMAGVTLEKIQKSLGSKKVVRFMPNTPIKIKLGAGILYFSEMLNGQIENKKKLISMLAKISLNIEVKSDKQLDQLTTISGSGPAYIFEFARYMSTAFDDLNLPEEDVANLVKRMFLGASTLMSNSSLDLEALTDQITSKGGVTIEALNAFREENTQDIFHKSLQAAYSRALELRG